MARQTSLSLSSLDQRCGGASARWAERTSRLNARPSRRSCSRHASFPQPGLQPADVPVAELVDEFLGMRRIWTRLVGCALDAVLRIADESRILFVGDPPDLREIV